MHPGKTLSGYLLQPRRSTCTCMCSKRSSARYQIVRIVHKNKGLLFIGASKRDRSRDQQRNNIVVRRELAQQRTQKLRFFYFRGICIRQCRNGILENLLRSHNLVATHVCSSVKQLTFKTPRRDDGKEPSPPGLCVMSSPDSCSRAAASTRVRRLPPR
jgi:hypothetical protein